MLQNVYNQTTRSIWSQVPFRLLLERKDTVLQWSPKCVPSHFLQFERHGLNFRWPLIHPCMGRGPLNVIRKRTDLAKVGLKSWLREESIPNLIWGSSANNHGFTLLPVAANDLWILPVNETADVIRRPFNWSNELGDKWCDRFSPVITFA